MTYPRVRTDREAPARVSQLGTRSPVLHHDGRDLAAALQTIREIGDSQALSEAVADAFPESRLDIVVQQDTRFSVEFYQHGLLRYLLWVAVLLTPRPPLLMVLRAGAKIISHFIHPGFRSSSLAPGVAKSSKELAIPPVLPPPERANLTQIRAPKM